MHLKSVKECCYVWSLNQSGGCISSNGSRADMWQQHTVTGLHWTEPPAGHSVWPGLRSFLTFDNCSQINGYSGYSIFANTFQVVLLFDKFLHRQVIWIEKTILQQLHTSIIIKSWPLTLIHWQQWVTFNIVQEWSNNTSFIISWYTIYPNASVIFLALSWKLFTLCDILYNIQMHSI